MNNPITNTEISSLEQIRFLQQSNPFLSFSMKELGLEIVSFQGLKTVEAFSLTHRYFNDIILHGVASKIENFMFNHGKQLFGANTLLRRDDLWFGIYTLPTNAFSLEKLMFAIQDNFPLIKSRHEEFKTLIIIFLDIGGGFETLERIYSNIIPSFYDKGMMISLFDPDQDEESIDRPWYVSLGSNYPMISIKYVSQYLRKKQNLYPNGINYINRYMYQLIG